MSTWVGVVCFILGYLVLSLLLAIGLGQLIKRNKL